MGCKYRVMDKCRAKDNLKDDFCFGKDSCPYYEDEVKVTSEDQYEARLKADFVAMLTDMLIDVEEIASREQWCDYANDNCISRYDVEDLIQKKIKSLKENADGTTSN